MIVIIYSSIASNRDNKLGINNNQLPIIEAQYESY